MAEYKVALAFEGDTAPDEARVDEAEQPGSDAETVPAPQVSPPMADGEEQTQAASTPDEQIKQLQTQLDDLKRSIKEWDELGIPVGWPDNNALPQCFDPNEDGKFDDRLLQELHSGTSTNRFRHYANLATIVLVDSRGLLIGLGAPFWAQAVGALTASRGASQKIASIVGGDDTIGSPVPDGDKVTSPAPAPATPVRTFQVSRKATKEIDN